MGKDQEKALETPQENSLERLRECFSPERMSVYASDGASLQIATARYLWNMSVCESLYAPLQMFEVGLRNAIDKSMMRITKNASWYDHIDLTPWGYDQIGHAKTKVSRSGRAVTPGRVVAELNLGFWTSMFESHYEKTRAQFLPSGIRLTFPRLPKSQHNRKKIKSQLERIRKLRNRIFHHERIIHWRDLPDQHDSLISMIGWISSDLKRVTALVDSFGSVYNDGTQPFLDQLNNSGYR